MRHEDLIKLAKVESPPDVASAFAKEFERLAQLVAEDCDKTCDKRIVGYCTRKVQEAGQYAGAIRAKFGMRS